MKTNLNMSNRQTVLKVLRRVGADAVLGAACSGLYGFVFGGFGALAQNEAQRLNSMAISFALGGAVAGALVGIWSAICCSNEKRTSDSDHFPHEQSETKQTPVRAVRHLLVPSRRQSQKSLASAASSDRRRMLPIVTKQPLAIIR
jgi:hypothetical protein